MMIRPDLVLDGIENGPGFHPKDMDFSDCPVRQSGDTLRIQRILRRPVVATLRRVRISEDPYHLFPCPADEVGYSNIEMVFRVPVGRVWRGKGWRNGISEG